jgi:hypothetical protein
MQQIALRYSGLYKVESMKEAIGMALQKKDE